jgi:hypothetical protein
VPAGQIADGVAGEKEDEAGFASDFAQLVESVLLVGR